MSQTMIDFANTSTKELISACQNGDIEAQRELYERHVHQIHQLVSRMVGTNDADDITQQVFLQVLRKIDQFSGRSQLNTWLYRIAVNESLQFRRRSARRPTLPLNFDPIANTEERRVERQDSLRLALARLEPELRSVLLLRVVKQMSYAQLAQHFSVPSGTIASRLNRAKREMRVALIDA